MYNAKLTGATLNEANRAFKALGKAMAKTDIPDLKAIAKIRMLIYKQQMGVWRFISPEFLRWSLLAYKK
jgi:hypothetical protein